MSSGTRTRALLGKEAGFLMAEKTLRCKKTPSDAELEAERDRKHERAVQEWLSRCGEEAQSDEW